MWRIPVAVVALISTCASMSLWADEPAKKTSDDPTAGKLESARKSYSDTLEKQRKLVVRDLEKAEKVASKAGDLVRVREILDQKDEFLIKGYIPTVVRTSDYQKAMKRAGLSFKEKLRSASEFYTRRGEYEKAKKVEEEIAKLDESTLIAAPARSGILVGAADSPDPATWSYTINDPGPDWNSSSYREQNWARAIGGFGTNKPRVEVANWTPWESDQIWLRTRFTMPKALPGDVLILKYFNDGMYRIYVNGELLASGGGWTEEYKEIKLDQRQSQLFRLGPNCIAITCEDKDGGKRAIDVGLSLIRAK